MKNSIINIIFCVIFIAPVTGFSQLRNVKGKVTAFDRFPLKNVTVTAKKAKMTAQTDENGLFEIAVKHNDVIQISNPVFADYSKKIKDEDNTLNINLIIKNDDEDMSKAVENGYISQSDMEYGRTHLANLNNEFSQFKDAYDAIKYALPECTLITENGERGVQFRGPKTINGSNMALILVDGVIVDDASFVSPVNIIKITRLTGPSAALYGARAANGVINISTK